MSEDKLPDLRRDIDRVDGELLDLLARRREISLEVARRKDRTQAEIRDSGREEELLIDLIRRGRERGLDAPFITRVYHEILDDSVRRQQRFVQDRVNAPSDESAMIRVACFGEAASYSHLAARQHFAWLGDRLRPIACKSFGDILSAVEAGQADYGLLPIENTTSGSINEVYDLLLHTRLHLVGETQLRVRHCLATAEEIPLHEIRRVFSHPQALAQCGRFLRSLVDCHIEVERNTATAARRVREETDRNQAAIASEEAIRAHGLHLLRRDVADHPDNTTRFVVVARAAVEVDARVPCKTSLVMATGQRAGALVDALLVFRDRDLAMTKLESRPVPENPFEELFYVDVEGNRTDPALAEGLEALRRVTRFVRVLGSYPSATLEPTRPSTERLHAPSEAKVIGTEATETDPSDMSVVRVGSLEFGAGPPVVLTQPASTVEAASAEDWARHAQEHGGRVLVEPAGASDSRSAWAQAAQRFGLAFCARIEAHDQVKAAADLADLLMIPATHMHDSALLDAVGRSLRPVLLERESGATAAQWIQCADRIRQTGNQQVILAEGAREQDPIELLELLRLIRESGLPLVAAPAAWSPDVQDWPDLARALRGAGAAGIWVEFHADEDAEGGVDTEGYAHLLREIFRP